MLRPKLKYIIKTIRLLLLLFSLPMGLYFVDIFIKIHINWSVLIIVVFIYSIPSIYLFGEYTLFSFNKKLIIDFLKKQIIINEDSIFTFEEISNIEKVCSYPFAERRRMWLSSDTFFFYKINFKNGKSIVFTSFMCDTFFSQNSKLKVVKRILPSILLFRYFH
jgi:hypothetical protein